MAKAGPVAVATQPMVRPQPDGFGSSARRAHPESYVVVRPQYLAMTPARLRARWQQSGDPFAEPILFYDENPALLPRFHFSNWHVGHEFTFQLPVWCHQAWVAAQGAPIEITATFGEKPLMLCKAALMRDLPSYRAILEAPTPAQVKSLGKRVSPFNEPLWLSRVCAVDVAVVRARAKLPSVLRDDMLRYRGRTIAEAAPTDLLHGIGLTHTDPRALHPNRWRGANVLGWAYMTVATELTPGEQPQQGKRPRAPVHTDDAVLDALAEDIIQAEDKMQGGLASLGEGPSVQALGDRWNTRAPRAALESNTHAHVSVPETPVIDAPPAPDPPQVSGGTVGNLVPDALAGNLPTVQVSALSAQNLQWAFCVILTTLLEPLVYTHVDGDTHMAVPLPISEDSGRGRDDRALDHAERAIAPLLSTSKPLLIPAGMTYPEKAPVIAAPVAFAPPAEMIVRTPQGRRSKLRAGLSFLFLTMAALSGTPAYRVAAPALARVNSFVRPALDLQEASLAGAVLGDQVRFIFGGTEVGSLVRDVVPQSGANGDAGQQCRRVHQHEHDLVRALRGAEGEGEIARYQRESAEAVHFLDLDSVPDQLCRPATESSDPRLDSLPFTHDCPVPVTDYVPRKAQQPSRCQACADTVSRCEEFILPVPACRGLVDQWWQNATADFERLRLQRRLEGVRKARTISLADDCMRPCTRGCWFDCRSEETEGVKVLDYQQDVGSQLNREKVRESIRGWPDQALASFVEYGILYPELPHILTLAPQLLSLADGFWRAQKELAELVQRGWYALFRHFPFFPFHMCPNGCTERKLEIERPRPTTDGSNPPCFPDGTARVFDTSGQPVYSPNWHARRAGTLPTEILCGECHTDATDQCIACQDCGGETDDGAEVDAPTWWQPWRERNNARLSRAPPSGWESRTSELWTPSFWQGYATWGWHGGRTPEFKPNLRGLLRDQAILRRPAHCLNLPVFQAGDDWKNAFNHLRVRPEALPRSVTASYSSPHLDEDALPHILFTAEYVMGFGHTDNSGVFQRLASFVQHRVMKRMDELERPRLLRLRRSHRCFDRWAQSRIALSVSTKRNEFRLYTMHTYSDDPIATCVGSQCVLNWLQAWREINVEFDMLAAIVAKRSVGTQVKWLGALPNAHLGYLTVPREKLLRVQGMLDKALAGELTKARYRSLMGFLEWFAWCFVHARSRMWGLYAPLRGMDDGTAVLVQPNQQMQQQLERWKRDLWQVAGVAVEAALPHRRRTLPTQSATFFVSMDAAKEGTSTPGIAGWCHGFTWAWFYPDDWLQLPIAVLEFLAFAVSVIQFAPMLRSAPRIVFETDSISAAFNLHKENANSPLMQEAFGLLLQTEEWQHLIVEAGEAERAVRHIKGKLNLFADGESRGYHALVSDLCHQLGINRRAMPLTSASVDYLQAFVSAVNHLLPLPLRGLGVAPSCIARDGPTLFGFMPAPVEADSPERPSSASRTLSEGRHAAPEAGRRTQLTLPPASTANESTIGRHVRAAILAITQDGISENHPAVGQLRLLHARFGTRASGSGTESLAAEQPRGSRMEPVQISSDYSLTGRQVATAYAPPNPEQPAARGYAPGSRYSLNPPEHLWQEYLQRRQTALQQSFPESSLQGADCHWKFWKAHCARWGCSTPIRDNFDAMSGRDPLGLRDELDLAASFVESRYFTMHARRRGDVPKPESALQSYLHVVRLMSSRSIPRLPLKELRQIVKGLTNSVIRDLGVEVLLPTRKQPISNELHDQLLNRIPEGSKMGTFIYKRDSHFGRSWRRALGILDRAGFRKAEWTAVSANGPTALTFRQVAYCIDGNPEPVRRPPLEQATALRNDQRRVCWLYLYPVPSKCDPDGSKFCTIAIPYLRNPAEDVVNLFLDEEIRMWEQQYSGEQRAREPLFSSEPGVAFHRSQIDDALRDALLLFVLLAVAMHISWHSYRIRLACKLKAAGFDDPTIQRMVRWNTDKAINIYGRPEKEYYWNMLVKADQHDATSVQFTALPEIDEMQRLLQRLDLQDKPPEEIEAKVLSIVNGAEGSSSVAQLLSQLPAPVAAPVPAPVATAVQPPAPRRRPRGELPAGWERRVVHAKSRTYPAFHGPNGETARSCVEAWRFAPPGHPPTLSAVGSAPTHAAGNPVLQSVSLSRAAALPSEGHYAPVSSTVSSPPRARDPQVSHGNIGGAQNDRCGPSSLAAGGETTNPSRGLSQAASRDARGRSQPVRPSRAAARQDLQLPLPLPAPPQAFYELVRGLCGTPGCGLPDHHPGVCLPLRPQSRRRH